MVIPFDLLYYNQPLKLPQNVSTTQKQTPMIEQVPQKIQGIMISGSSTDTSAGVSANAGVKIVENGDELIDDDDEEMGELPPKLPMPVGKMNCSVTRWVFG